MTQAQTDTSFTAALLRPASAGDQEVWAFVVLPKAVSDILPRRGRVTVDGRINGHTFRALLEPDGQKSHWLKIDESMMKMSGASIGDVAQFDITPVAEEPEPEVPQDLLDALQEHPEALDTWRATTPIARLDWIHWVTTAKQAKTRTKRINDACDMLASGKKRVCCFDPSGFYSKAFCAPKLEE